MLHDKVLGIVGGGQLALFTALAAAKHGLPFIIFAQNESEPACLEFPANSFYGSIGDGVALSKALANCTHISLENEFWSPKILKKSLKDKIFCPNLNGYTQVFGKIEQRKLMQTLGVSQPNFHVVHNLNEAQLAFEKLGQKVVIKKDTGGYDGTGNITATNWDQVAKACDKFGLNKNSPLLFENLLSLTREIALTFFIHKKKISFWPVVETIQDEHICTTAISPANLSLAEGERLERVAKHLRTRGFEGLYTIEFFREQRGDWLYNEIAPRPHNSQHLSMDNCEISQYDAIVFWVLGKTMPKYVPMYNDAVMVNILGKDEKNEYKLALPNIDQNISLKTYMYGKKESRIGRKLGHLSLIGPRELIQDEAKKISKEYRL